MCVGTAYKNLPEGCKFSPAVSLYANSQISLNIDADMPTDDINIKDPLVEN